MASEREEDHPHRLLGGHAGDANEAPTTSDLVKGARVRRSTADGPSQERCSVLRADTVTPSLVLQVTRV